MTPAEIIVTQLQGIHDDITELFAKLDSTEIKRRNLLDDYETVNSQDHLEMGGFRND